MVLRFESYRDTCHIVTHVILRQHEDTALMYSPYEDAVSQIGFWDHKNVSIALKMKMFFRLH